MEQRRERTATVFDVARLRLGDVRLVPPQAPPFEAVAKDASYTFKVMVQVRVQYIERRDAVDVTVKTEDLGEILLCVLPAMVKSFVCALESKEWTADLGGYFIVDGRERVLPLLEERDPAALVVRRHRGNWTAELKGFRAVLREDTEREYRGDIDVFLPGKKKGYPLFVVMRALGLESDADVVDHCLLGKDFDLLAPLLVPSVHASGKIFNATVASAFVGGLEEDEGVAYALGRMVRQLLLVQVGAAEPTDERSLEVLRVRTNGAIFQELFTEACGAWKVKWADAEFGDVRAFFQEGRDIGKRLFERLSEPLRDRVSSLRRVQRAFESEGLHASHWGMYDVVTASELASLVRVSEDVPSEALRASLGLVPLDGATPKEHGRLVRFILNGEWVGSLSDPTEALGKINELRRIHSNVNVSFSDMELAVRTSEGRLQRPLRSATDYSSILYLDSREVSAAFVAENLESVEKRHTHVELHGSLLFGQKANQTLVFADHTAVPVSRGACAFDATTVDRRAYLNSEEAVEELQDREIPLVRSAYAPPLRSDGLNVVVALMCYENHSVVFNQAALDRGLFRTYQYVTKYAQKKDHAVGDDVGGGWTVDRVYWTKKDKQKIRLKKQGSVDLGAVFGTRSGLKTVCSAVLPEKDMPFTHQGVVPDVLINPLMLECPAPFLLEGLFGKVHALRGSIGDGTAFQPDATKKYVAELKKGGKYREEVVTDGKTGAQIQTAIFVAPVYLRLQKSRNALEDSRGFFGEAETAAALANGMSAVVRSAASGEVTELTIDACTGVQAVENGALGVVAPELDGPLEFDGQMKMLTRRRHPNRFLPLRLPKSTHAALSELRTMNIQMRFVTRPANEWFHFEQDVSKSSFFHTLPVDPFDALDNTLYVARSPAGCDDLLEKGLFPVVETKELLLRVLIAALEIAPTADSKRAPFNEDKLDMDVYANMDWRSARQTLQYCFRKTNGGVFVRIQNNRVANFFPLRNTGFGNDFHDRLSLDGKTGANPHSLEPLVHVRPSKWVAVGNTVEPSDADPKLAQLYDMLVNTCSRLVVRDCVVVFNRSEYPYLGADHLEANPHVHGAGKKVDSVWKKSYVPILSPCTSPKHADLPVPTAEDWESITQEYFTTLADGKPVCRNRFIAEETTPWANRTANVPKSEADPNHVLPVFYWRGVENGGENHPRTLLNKATARYSKERKGSAVPAGVLDARTLPSSAVTLVHASDTNLVVVHAAAESDPPGKMKLVDQAKKYKFTFDVEGAAASYRFGALFRLGFCVLHVETPFQLWFERLLGPDGEPLLKGGDVEQYQDDWAYVGVLRDLTNLERTVEWCLRNEEKCRRIAENGKRFYATYFTRQYVYEYMAATLNAVSGRQRVVDRTLQEEQTWLKDVTSAYDALARLPALVRHTYDVSAPIPLKNTVVVVPFQGADHQIALHQWLKHHKTKKHNVLVVRQAEGAFNRGALLNAAFLYVTSRCPEVDRLVFADPEALFSSDFVDRYFGADGKEVVDFGKPFEMPLAWAVKVSKEVFRKVNGFPNNMVKGGASEAFENRLRVAGVPVYTPSTRAMAQAPKREDPTKKDDVRGALVLDAMQWRVDGVNTLQYSVTDILVGNWTLKTPNHDANIRTLTVRLTPEAEVADLGSKKGAPSPVEDVTDLGVTDLGATDLGVTDLGATDLGATASKEPPKGGADGMNEPGHFKTIELAHPMLMEPAGGGKVVNILDDEVSVEQEELPHLHDTRTMPTDSINDLKTVKVQL